MTDVPAPAETPADNECSYRPWSHVAAWLVACVTFPLIWVGGLVTTYDAGMAVPDWPSTYGYNLFLYPWQSWFAGPWDLFIEHGHRQLGALVGLLAIFFLVVTWRDRRPYMKGLAIATLVLVIVQGLLGGQRVLLDDRRIAQLHGCVGPMFFALAVALTTLTSRWWFRPTGIDSASDSKKRTRLRTSVFAAWLAFGLAVAQLLLGSQLRHGVEYSSAAVFRGAVLFHIGLAVALACQIIFVAVRALRIRGTRRIGLGLVALVTVQLLLGLGTWAAKYGWPAILQDVWAQPAFLVQAESMWQSLTVTAHVATGSLILALAGLLALRLTRIAAVSYNHASSMNADESSSDGARSGYASRRQSKTIQQVSVQVGASV